MANDRSRHNPDFWIKAFRVAGFVMLAVVAARLVKVQVIDGGVYGKRAQRQHTIRHKIPAKRGNIYDRNGRLLASSMGVETVWFYKPHVEPSRIGEAAAVFARILGGSADEYFRKIVNGPKYVRVARHIDNETAEALREANLRGVNITQEPLRYYPNNSVAAQLLGFCDPDGVGLEGLEKQFDRYLAGEDGYSVIVQDALNKPISTCEDAHVEPRPGYDLALTIDVWIQSILEDEMFKQCEKYPPKGAVGVVLDATNGEVLAMSSWPTFDPNKHTLYPPESYRNRVVTDVYEPGSMAKAFTAAAALEYGIMNPDTIIDCEGGRYYLHGRTVRDAGSHGYNEISLTKVISKSSNVGAAKIGEAVGKERLYDTLCAFGLRTRSGMGLWGEEYPWLYPPSKWSKKSVASISFGYELCVTPIALARAYTAIARDGTFPDISVVRGVYSPNGGRLGVEVGEHGPRKRAISERTAAQLRMILRQVVLDGTCRAANIPEYKIAGKTGTALKVKNGKYVWDKTLSSFIGFAPLEDPQIVVLISLDEPTRAQYGGTVAGPAVTEVIRRTLEYLGVPKANDTE